MNIFNCKKACCNNKKYKKELKNKIKKILNKNKEKIIDFFNKEIELNSYKGKHFALSFDEIPLMSKLNIGEECYFNKKFYKFVKKIFSKFGYRVSYGCGDGYLWKTNNMAIHFTWGWLKLFC